MTYLRQSDFNQARIDLESKITGTENELNSIKMEVNALSDKKISNNFNSLNVASLSVSVVSITLAIVILVGGVWGAWTFSQMTKENNEMIKKNEEIQNKISSQLAESVLNYMYYDILRKTDSSNYWDKQRAIAIMIKVATDTKVAPYDRKFFSMYFEGTLIDLLSSINYTKTKDNKINQDQFQALAYSINPIYDFFHKDVINEAYNKCGLKEKGTCFNDLLKLLELEGEDFIGRGKTIDILKALMKSQDKVIP